MAQSTQIKELSMNSYCFYGKSKPGTTLDLIPQGAPFGNSSREIFPVSYSFSNKSTAQTFQSLMEFSYTPYPVSDTGGNLGYVVSTVHNKFFVPAEDMARYGAVFNPRDESAKHMDRWIGATVGNHQIESATPNKEEGLWEMPEHIPGYSKYGMTDVMVPIKDLAGSVPINKVGLYVSRIANLEQDLRDVIFRNHITSGVGFNPETEAFLDFLIKEKGLEPEREIRAIGVENLVVGMAATYPENGTAVLVASKDIYQYAADIAKTYGLKGEEARRVVKRAIWYHELYHVFDQRKGLSMREEEIDVREALAEFFSERASMVGEKLARYYKAMAKENQEYVWGWEEGPIKSQGGRSARHNIETLMQQYASEAKRMGMSGEEVGDYVASRLKAELGGGNGNRGDAKIAQSGKKSGKAAIEKEPEEKTAYAAAEPEQTPEDSEQAKTGNGEEENGNPGADSGTAESSQP